MQPVTDDGSYLSASMFDLAAAKLGKANDVVAASQEEWLKNRCESFLTEVDSINSSASPFGFLCIVALIAYFGELSFGNTTGNVSAKQKSDFAKDNKNHFCRFMREKMSRECRKYDNVAGDIYFQVRNGLAHCMMLFDQRGSQNKIAISHDERFSSGRETGQIGPLKTESINGKRITVLCAKDLISDLRYAVQGMFNDKRMINRMVEFSRHHPPIIGTKAN